MPHAFRPDVWGCGPTSGRVLGVLGGVEISLLWLLNEHRRKAIWPWIITSDFVYGFKYSLRWKLDWIAFDAVWDLFFGL